MTPPVSRPLPAAFDPAGFRLLIVADSSTTHTHRWAQWFASRGSDVTVLSHVGDAIQGVRVVKFPPRRRWYHRIPKLRMLLDCRPFRQLVRQIDPQLIHFHFVSEGGRAFYWDAIDVPMVASSWGQDVIFDTGPRPKAEASLRKIFARCGRITATTHMLAEATAPFVPAGRPIHVIPFGVDLSRFLVRDENLTDELTIGFVKHLLPKYGPDILIEAFASVHRERPRTRLVMAGRGSMQADLERRVAQLGLSDCVSILGRVPHERVPDLVRGFDIMAMPSIYESETFGVAAIEASACGVANVASRIGGVGEAVLDGITGLLVPPRDVDALASAILALIGDPARRRAMGLAGRRLVEKYYVWQDNCRLMEEVYRAALAGDEPRDVPVYRPGIGPSFDL
jgi:glycosyltransferase involved in cell wall biosynthesis